MKNSKNKVPSLFAAFSFLLVLFLNDIRADIIINKKKILHYLDLLSIKNIVILPV